ncbi:SfnB family sulfur acquisition oxidoreductase [Achromobacter ruhlandii]|uniref:SfnB family sulfur acquisition oxidoreductase n=1 Tax=Achromobacter ruhlandii TaxID=72557 RepID=UPI0007431476|nr:SfnB family sulfur acquisition oxidoreductase [Achromobacter ruhlandii]ALX82005.1 SfnB family sulfur acquisition oxidoreductase [Achromobacter denitrificans]OCZ97625.1 SfnB family sulfur acquisition oxidoreductase [Achromobacter xylosoxidans]MCV6796947.1 SfnB family sulfur acquisition oxidoreductase [Achromobacter ruhlandii]MCV6810106.1 SfnB family sulfur acquisition oxidoreductase [Achromobacter ruhlandii]MCV6818497.1 SfnB family sulfur acquisition oxidoreductase [Achromobacter ruhlandii]
MTDIAISTLAPRRAAIIDSDAQAIAVARELAADFARDAAVRDRERRLPLPELERYSQSGLWGITVPREHGGAGVSRVTLAEVTAIISGADGSLGQIPQNHYYALEVLRVNGNADQQRRFYARALAGERFGNALAEIGTRTAAERRTRLSADGRGGWRINGSKFYCTGALYAQWIPTATVGEDGLQRLAFVRRDSPGVEVIDDWSGFGQRVTGSGTVLFQDVAVPAEDVMVLVDPSAPPNTIKPLAQIIHAAIDLGIGQAALADALDFVRERSRPWIDAGVERAADDPLTISEFGRLSIRLDAARALVARAGRILDVATADPQPHLVAAAAIAVAEARALTTESALAAGTKLFELAGTQATLDQLNLDRHWRNARTHTLHDPVRWKRHAVGNYYLNDAAPGRVGTT